MMARAVTDLGIRLPRLPPDFAAHHLPRGSLILGLVNYWTLRGCWGLHLKCEKSQMEKPVPTAAQTATWHQNDTGSFPGDSYRTRRGTIGQ